MGLHGGVGIAAGFPHPEYQQVFDQVPALS